MIVSLGTVLGAPQIQFPGGADTTLMLMRWVHFVAGIMWMGLLYFFNLVSLPFVRELDAKSTGIVVPKLMSRALWWFRWSAVVTVLVGFGYWNRIVAIDAQNVTAAGETASAGAMIGSFFGLWTMAFLIEMGILMSPAKALKKGPVLGMIMAVVIFAAAWCFLALNQHGWESNRALAIGIGGGLGWFMMFNVWGIVWRIQKKIIHWNTAALAEGTPIPPEAAQLSRISSLVARVNFWVSFPMLFFMGASSHYLVFTQP